MYRIRLMRLVSKLVIATLFVSFTANSKLNSEKVNIAVSEIPYLLSQSTELFGPYNLLLDSLDQVNIFYVPPGRAGIEFEQKDFFDCLFPGSFKSIPNAEGLLESEAVKKVNAYLFYYPNKVSEPDIYDPDTHIAIRRGFSFGNIRLKIKARITEFNSDNTSLLFLQAGRADAVIAYLSDLEGAAKAASVVMPAFDKNNILYSAPDAFLCKASTKNAKFIGDVNQKIKMFKKANASTLSQ